MWIKTLSTIQAIRLHLFLQIKQFVCHVTKIWGLFGFSGPRRTTVCGLKSEYTWSKSRNDVIFRQALTVMSGKIMSVSMSAISCPTFPRPLFLTGLVPSQVPWLVKVRIYTCKYSSQANQTRNPEPKSLWKWFWISTPDGNNAVPVTFQLSRVYWVEEL